MLPSEDAVSAWLMFNDFSVRPVSEEAVFSFPEQWKVPAVIIFERIDTESVLDLRKLPTSLDPDGLFRDVSMAW